MPSAVLRVAGGDADRIVSAVAPEARRDILRTHVGIANEGGDAVLRIEAADTSAMRAALNSYLECIMITENIDRVTRCPE